MTLPKTNTLGSILRCDAVLMPTVTPCPNRATVKRVPVHVPGKNFTITYWCKAHS